MNAAIVVVRAAVNHLHTLSFVVKLTSSVPVQCSAMLNPVELGPVTGLGLLAPWLTEP